MALIEPEFMALTRSFDPQAFWAENEQCMIFSPNKPRCGFSYSPDDHWIFEFVDVPSTLRYYFDQPYRNQLHREVNQVLLQYIGQPYFDEDTWVHSPRRIENLFDCEFSYTEGGTPWLTPATNDPDAFASILDKAERTDMAGWAFPDDYLREWEARKAAGLPLPKLGTGSRGPATIMTSVLPTETVFFWLYDYPDLMRRFRDILMVKMVEFNQALRKFSGNDEAGWWITDDNCAFFNRKMYREYCFPILQAVLQAMAPGLCRRYQHSDSSMGHLLEMQRELGINITNYGPEVDAGLIREKMPEAMILGQTPPMLVRNGSPEEIRQRVIEDFHKAGAGGGLTVATAGSLAGGTGMGRLRYYMQLVQDECRYDR